MCLDVELRCPLLLVAMPFAPSNGSIGAWVMLEDVGSTKFHPKNHSQPLEPRASLLVTFGHDDMLFRSILNDS